MSDFGSYIQDGPTFAKFPPIGGLEFGTDYNGHMHLHILRRKPGVER